MQVSVHDNAEDFSVSEKNPLLRSFFLERQAAHMAGDGTLMEATGFEVVSGTSRATSVAMLSILRGSLLALYPKQGHGWRRTRCGHWQMAHNELL